METLNSELRNRLLRITALCSEYCLTVENAASQERDEFVRNTLSLLPQIYYEFLTCEGDSAMLDEEDYFADYVDEDYYESVRRNIEHLLGPDDVFLETFEEDMKYSDTPIGASIGECLADIFQPLYNYISIVRETEGDKMSEAYTECRENFIAYWSQTLCNVLRALNNLYTTNTHTND
ncbi:MAG: DUF5063 domain-containing protein [Muribaculaceae bacterium]|nr:DUF5063 domain-containing protein [Muribaculaceae bacterium]